MYVHTIVSRPEKCPIDFTTTICSAKSQFTWSAIWGVQWL